MPSYARLILACLCAVCPAPLRYVAMRVLLGAKLGRRARIGFGSVLWAREIEIGSHVQVGRFSRLKADRLRIDDYSIVGHSVRMTANLVFMESRSRIDAGSVLAGNAADPRSKFSMGMNSWIFPGCYVDLTRGVSLGRNVGVGGRSLIFSHGLWLSQLEGYPVAYGEVRIGDDVWLPWESFVLPNLEIGAGCVFGPRPVVTTSVPPRTFAVGNPAKPVGQGLFRKPARSSVVKELVAITEEFASQRGGSVEHVSSDERAVVLSGGGLTVRIHVAAGGPVDLDPSDRSLNIIFPAGHHPQHGVWWNQGDSVSSSFGGMPSPVRAWFEVARTRGVRLYPVDELRRYSR